MSDSKKWKRVEAALNGLTPDRVPYAFWGHFPEIDRDADKLIQATLDLHRRYDQDFIKVMFRSSFGTEDWGNRAEKFDQSIGYWVTTNFAVQTAEDWRKLKPLNPKEGALGEQLYILKKLAADLNGDAPILTTLFSPTMLAGQLAGQETFKKHLLEDPDSVHIGLQAIAETVVNFGLASLESGADGLFYAVFSATPTIFAKPAYKALAETYDKPVLTELHKSSRFTLLHGHGDNLYFDELVEYPFHTINWNDRGQNLSLKEARNHTSKSLSGGIDHLHTLVEGRPEQVKAEIQEAITQVNGKGLLIAPGCGIPTNVPRENLQAIKEATFATV
jgi:uroporphyrinogen decarboxylase